MSPKGAAAASAAAATVLADNCGVYKIKNMIIQNNNIVVREMRQQNA
jgi:hypothetical protein